MFWIISPGLAQVDWVGTYECKKGNLTWTLKINSDFTYGLNIQVPGGAEGGPGTWKKDKYIIKLFRGGEDKPHTIYKVKFKGEVQMLKSKKMFGSRLFRQRKYKLKKL